jgi:crotonobetainyl-CoA:carnitine CoA-transferase CaiB-like acyl-CoA transferase
MLALEGIKILDLTRGAPGPFCTWILGDLGAEVIRIEPPPAMGARVLGIGSSPIDEAGRRKAVYEAGNRNKKSVGLNLGTEEGCNIFYQLAEKADVIVEGFRPGVAKRLGIDYETISKINPGIVYCSITGYGQSGPYRNLPGHDINCISMGGVLSLIGDNDGYPIIPLNLVADYGGGGMYAAVGILSALIARNNTGKGQYVDISLTDSVISLLQFYTTAYFCYGTTPKMGGLLTGGAYPYYNVYKTRDGKFITIGCLEPWLWRNLCQAVGKEDFTPFHFEKEHFSRPPEGEKWREVYSSLKQIFLTKTRDEWFELLSRKNVPVGKVYLLDDVFADPQVLHRQMVIEVEHPTEGKIRQVGIAIKLSDTPGNVRSLSPMLGEHTEEILTGLGYSKQRISELHQKSVIG